MVELSPGSRVFVYQTSIDVASSKSPSGAACFLLSCFFSNSELVGSNLSGANGKKQLNPQIIDAIVCKLLLLAVSYILTMNVMQKNQSVNLVHTLKDTKKTVA